MILSKDYRETVNYLEERLKYYQPKNFEKDEIYNAELIAEDLPVKNMPELKDFMTPLSWGRIVIDRKAQEVGLEGFIGPDGFKLNDFFVKSNWEYLMKRATIDASKYGCSYIRLTESPDTFGRNDIRGEIESPNSFIADFDSFGNINIALKLFYPKKNKSEDVDYSQSPYAGTLYTRNEIISFEYDDDFTIEEIVSHNLGWVPVQKIVNRPSASNPNGESDLTLSIESSIKNGMRAIKALVINSELSAMPGKYIIGNIGKDSGSDYKKVLQEYKDAITLLRTPPGGDKPIVGQWDPVSPSGIIEALNIFAMQISAESGVPMSQLVRTTSNPESGDAINAQSDVLYKRAEDSQTDYTKPIIDLAKMYVIYKNNGNIPEDIDDINLVWGNPKNINYGAAADAVFKLVQLKVVNPESFVVGKILGLSRREMDLIKEENRVYKIENPEPIEEGTVVVPAEEEVVEEGE